LLRYNIHVFIYYRQISKYLVVTIAVMSESVSTLRDDFYSSLDNLEAEYSDLNMMEPLTLDADYMRLYEFKFLLKNIMEQLDRQL